MKKFCFALVLLIAIGFSAQAQKVKMNRVDSLAYDLAYTKYNIGKFKSQMMTGILITSIGMVSIPLFQAINVKPELDFSKISDANYNKLYMNDEKLYKDRNTVFMFISGGIVILGTIITIDSYSWLKRASLKPSQYGVSFTYDLDIE